MPKTVQEILKESGLTDDQIAAIDAKAITGFSTLVTSATAAQEAAELALRQQKDMLEKEINPALDSWASEKANLEAQVAFYRTQNEQARSGGFVPKDAPGFNPNPSNPNPGNPNPQFAPGSNPVPGSPGIPGLSPADTIKIVGASTWAINEYQRLYGNVIPDDVDKLIEEAHAQHLQFKDYVSKKYNFDGKRQEIAAQAQKAHDEKIIKDTEARVRQELAERNGSNPHIGFPAESQFSTLNKAVADGKAKDPLSMNQTERHQATRAAVQQSAAQRETVQ